MTPLLLAHVLAALLALPLGAYQLLRPTKGDARHVLLGRVWAVLMLWVALSSFWIRDLRDGRLSLLHVLSVVTLVTVTLGVLAARRGDVAAHKGHMLGSWFGLLGAFVGAVAVPGRVIPTFVVTEPIGALAATLALGTGTVVLIALGALVTRGVDGADPAAVPGRSRPGGRSATGVSRT